MLKARDERLGSTIGGKYRIVRFLAEGGMGAVYEAQHLVVKRRFAVKFLRADLARRRDVLARFKREAEATGALEGENIAAAVDFGIADGGAPYIVMEYLDGVDLGALLEQVGPLPVSRAADLAIQACTGMQEAHLAGVVHRDLKPHNLFVCRRRDGSDLLKIVDFGVAKLLAGDPTSQVTRTGSWVGTPSYMSPEQARGETEVDARADVYALGVILYEMLSGKTPHRGDSFNAVIHNIATQPPAPLCAEGREFPRELELIVERALSSNPAERQASAAELGQALAPFGRREVWAEVDERPPPLPIPEQESEDKGKALGRRGQLVSWSALVALVLLGVLWLATRSTKQTEADPEVASRVESPSKLDTPTVPSHVPTPVAPAAAENRPTPLDPVPARSAPTTSPSTTSGRTAGRPPKNGGASPTPPKAAVSADVTATFDTRDPYE